MNEQTAGKLLASGLLRYLFVPILYSSDMFISWLLLSAAGAVEAAEGRQIRRQVVILTKVFVYVQNERLTPQLFTRTETLDANCLTCLTFATYSNV